MNTNFIIIYFSVFITFHFLNLFISFKPILINKPGLSTEEYFTHNHIILSVFGLSFGYFRLSHITLLRKHQVFLGIESQWSKVWKDHYSIPLVLHSVAY